jgi:hypothetical protein
LGRPDDFAVLISLNVSIGKGRLAPAFLFAFQLVCISVGLLPAAAITRRLWPENAARLNKPLMA